jgi:hypothetical protein
MILSELLLLASTIDGEEIPFLLLSCLTRRQYEPLDNVGGWCSRSLSSSAAGELE